MVSEWKDVALDVVHSEEWRSQNGNRSQNVTELNSGSYQQPQCSWQEVISQHTFSRRPRRNHHQPGNYSHSISTRRPKVLAQSDGERCCGVSKTRENENHIAGAIRNHVCICCISQNESEHTARMGFVEIWVLMMGTMVNGEHAGCWW